MEHFEVAVLGLGAMGSHTVWSLAERGARVLGIDQWSPPHEAGSSHGLSRLIRLAYFEHPHYVPLLRRSYARWSRLEQLAQDDLFVRCGLLEAGPEASELIQGVRASAETHGLNLNEYSAQDTQRLFPGFQLPADWTVLHEIEAGFLRPERCITAALNAGREAGGKLSTNTTVTELVPTDKHVRITMNRSGETLEASADRVLMALGPWSPLWKDWIQVPIELLQKTLYWLETDDPKLQLAEGCPCFLFAHPSGIYYGMPGEQGLGLKIARHDGGIPIDSVDPVAEDPLEADRILNASRELFASRPHTIRERVHCRYSMTPDGDFALGHSPHDPRVLFVAGLSGHGFKFASGLGDLLAEWLVTDRCPESLEFLAWPRRNSQV